MLTQKNRKKKSVQTILLRVFFGSLTLLILAFLIVSNWKINQKRTELNDKMEALRKEIQILEERNQGFKANISQSTDEDYLEKVAREQLDLQKPGEEQVVIKKEAKSQEEVKTKEEKNFWNPKFWWEWLKSKLRD